MQCIKRFFILTIGALALIFISVLILAIILEENPRPILVWATKQFSGYVVEIKGPVSVDLSLTPSLSASGILISSQKRDSAVAFYRIDRINTRIALFPLLLGKLHILNLEVDSASVSWNPWGRTPSSAYKKIKAPDKTNLRNITLYIPPHGHRSSLVIYARNMLLEQFGEGKSLAIKGNGKINTHAFRINGRFGISARDSHPAETYPVDLGLEIADLYMKVSGTVDDPGQWKGLHLNVDMKERESATLLKMLGIESGLIGPMYLQAELNGSIASPGFAGILISIGDSPRLSLTVSGVIPDLKSGDGANLRVIGSCSDKRLLHFLSLDRFKMAALAFQGTLHGTWKGLILEDISASAVSDRNVQIRTQGKAQLGSWPYHPRAWSFSLNVVLLSPTVSALLSRHEQFMSGMSPVKGTFRVMGTPEQFAVEDIDIVFGNDQSLGMRWTGHVGRVEPGGKKLFSQVSLHGSFHAETISRLDPLFGVSLPDIGPFSTQGNLIDHGGVYALEDLEIMLGEAGTIRLEAFGRVETIMRDKKILPGKITMRCMIMSPDPGPLKKLLGLKKKYLESFNGSFNLAGSMHDLSMINVHVRGHMVRKAEVSLQGSMRHLNVKAHPIIQEVDLSLQGSAPDSGIFSEILGKKLPDMGPLHLKAHLGGKRESLEPNSLELQASLINKDTFSVSARGIVADVLTAPAFRGDLVSNIQGVSPRGPFHSAGVITIKEHTMSYEGSMLLGKTSFTTTMAASFARERPRIVTKIHAPIIYLEDIEPAQPAIKFQTSYKPSNKRTGKRIFSTLPLHLDLPKTVDISAGITAAKVQGYASKDTFSDLSLDASLSNGYLKLNPINLQYAGGSVSMDLSIDSHGKTPDMEVWLMTEDMDLATLQDYLHKPQYLEGKMSVTAYLHGQGNSAHEIASSLEGDIGFAIENGTIHRDVEILGEDGFDMAISFTKSIAADAIDLVLPTSENKKNIALNCMAARFNFQKGIGLSNIIAFETSDSITDGFGTLNLKNETMDVVIRTKSKKRLFNWSSPVYISGQMGKPSFRKIPWQEVAQLSAGIFAPYVFLPARGLGYLRYLLKNDTDKNSPCEHLNINNAD